MTNPITMQRNLLRPLGILTLASLFTGAALAATTLKPNEALQALQAGNARYVADQAQHPNQDAARRSAVAKGQNPFATVLTCSDSRVPVEVLFDQGIGDTFVIRVAGNVADTDEIGSIEYGVGHLNTPLLVVLGHSSCGAVKAVCEGAQVHGSIPKLVDNIIPAVAKAKESGATGAALISAAVTANVWQSVDDIFKHSAEVRDLVQAGKLTVVGAIYDLESGTVNFLGAHPQQAQLLTYTGGEGHDTEHGGGAAAAHNDHSATATVASAGPAGSGHSESSRDHGTTTATTATTATPHSTAAAAPAATNHTPWIIGGLVGVALLGLGIHAFAQKGMQTWPIGRRIAAGFGLVLAILTLVGAIAYEGFHSTYEGFVEYRADARHSVLAGRIQANFLEMQVASKDFMLTKNSADVTHYHARKEKVLEFIAEATQEIQEPERAQMVKTIASELSQHYTSFAEIVTLVGQQGSPARIAELNKAMAQAGDTIDHQVEELKLEFVGDQNQAGPLIQNKIQNTKALALWISIGALLLGVVSAWVIARSITGPLREMSNQISLGTTQVSAAASQVSSTSQTLAEGASEQAASLEETSASLEEISSMIKRNATNATSAKTLANETRQAADTGVTNMTEMSQAMNGIKTSSDNVAKIIKTIDEIAFQTNLLALNAAVEAARAGEAGAGFAVVADEVRSLAQRSAVAAKETATKIEDAIHQSEQGVAISGKVATSLQEIVSKVRQVDDLVAEIASASNEQSQGIGQITVATNQMDSVTQSNAASAEESASASEELNAQAGTLQGIVEELQLLVTGTKPQLNAAAFASTAAAPSSPAKGSSPKPIATTKKAARKSSPAKPALAPHRDEAHAAFGQSLQAKPTPAGAQSFQDF